MIRLLKIILIFILSVLTIGVVVFLTLVLTNKIDIKDFKFSISTNRYKKIVFDKEYENIYKELILKTEAADINIKKSENEKIRVVVYSDKNRTTVNTDNEVLNIEVKNKKCHGFCVNTKIGKIIVYLPSDYNNKITLKTNYGDIKAGSVTNFKANTNYGDIKLDKVNEYLNVKTNYGDIKIGEVNITKDSKVSTNCGDIKIGKTNDIYIDADTDLGDKKIKKNNRKADITLKLNTNLGDVKVNN